MGGRTDELVVGDRLARAALRGRGPTRAPACGGDAEGRRDAGQGASCYRTTRLPARISAGERARRNGLPVAHPQGRARAAGADHRRSPRRGRCRRKRLAHQRNLLGEHPAQRRRVCVGRRDEAVGLDARRASDAPARLDRPAGLVAVEAHELRRAASAQACERAGAKRRRGAAARAESRAGRSSRPRAGARPASSTISGERSPSGCRSRAGITSSVTRSTPWSSSQSRISAQRSNVAGSMSCRATAILRAFSGGTCHLLRGRVRLSARR